MLEYNTPKAPAVVTMGDFHFRHTQMTVTPHPYINPKIKSVIAVYHFIN